MACSNSSVPVRVDQQREALDQVTSHGTDCVPLRRLSDSIASLRSGSDGSYHLAKNWRRDDGGARRRRYASGGAGDAGSEKRRGTAHSDRSDVGKLNLLAVDEGAHRVAHNSSSELRLTTAMLCRRRGQRYGSRGSKRKTQLDARGHGVDACVKEKERGGQVLTRGVAGVANKWWRYCSSLLSTLQSTRGQANATGRCAWRWRVCELGRGGKGR